MMFSYFAYGLYIQSDIEILEFIPTQKSSDISIYLNNYVAIPEEIIGEHSYVINLGLQEAILFDKKAALFVIRNGCEVTVRPFTNDQRLISLYIIGMVMSILLYQRGLFVLHGSAVEVDGGIIAFVGQSGLGKSTIAAAFHTQGHHIITDDVVAASVEENAVRVFPGYPQLKLFPEVAEFLGHEKSELLFLHSHLNKGGFRVEEKFSQTALPLKGIYMLAQDSKIGIEQLRPQEALMELMRNSLPTRWNQTHNKSQFLQCTSVAKNIPIYRLTRSDDMRSLPTLIEMVKATLTHDISNLQVSIA